MVKDLTKKQITLTPFILIKQNMDGRQSFSSFGEMPKAYY